MNTSLGTDALYVCDNAYNFYKVNLEVINGTDYKKYVDELLPRHCWIGKRSYRCDGVRGSYVINEGLFKEVLKVWQLEISWREVLMVR